MPPTTPRPSRRRNVRSSLVTRPDRYMKLLRAGVACLIVAAVIYGSGAAHFAPAEAQSLEAPRPLVKPSVPEFVPGEVLVRFRAGASALRSKASVDREIKAYDGHRIVARIDRFDGDDLVEGLRLARVEAGDTLDAVQAFERDPDVLYAEPNYIYRAERLPNDPRFAEMYALRNTGQSGGTPGADIDAEAAWDVTTGDRNVVVGVVDEGIDINHPDLQANIWRNPGETPGDGIDNDANGRIDDTNGWDFHNNDASVFDGADDHGTHVAGTIGAAGDNSIGMTGINWQVSLMSLKVLGADGGSASKMIEAYRYAKQMRELWLSSGGTRGANVRVLNNSYGGSGFSQSAYLAIQELAGAGILFAAAAGNDGTDNDTYAHFPSSYDLPNIIGVAATDRVDGLASFSQFGARTVSMGAPGRTILSTIPNNSYAFYGGTSMATPHVAGGAALLLAANPNLSLQQLRGALLYGGDLLPALQGKTTTGRRLNLVRSLQSATENDFTPPAQVGGLRVIGQIGRSVTLAWNAPGDDGVVGRAADYDVVFRDGAAPASPFVLPFSVTPASVGTQQTATVSIPFRHTSGTIELHSFDNVGNVSVTTLQVSIPLTGASDPYQPTVNSTSPPLSTSGSPLSIIGDDRYRENYSLPFPFPFFGTNRHQLTISTNGALYFSSPPRGTPPDNAPPEEIAADARGSIATLNGLAMIAGLQDDLRTDRRAGDDVYVVQPDSDRIIFRWQAVTYDTPTGTGSRGENPVSFEIELRRDGTIEFRYGGGNTRLFPLVGIGGGEPEAYVISSHTSLNRTVNLTNAPGVTFTPRAFDATPAALQFSTASFSANEIDERAVVTVTRSGNLSAASSVVVETSDGAGLSPCDQATGYASARCDYTAVAETVRFAAGESARTIAVPLVNDAHTEGSETFVVELGYAENAFVSGQGTAVVTIADSMRSGANPIDDTRTFVRQHYLDFLNREPDAPGLAGWMSVLNNCHLQGGLGSNDPSCDRVAVSSAFYRSPEFQSLGYLVYRYYEAALGRQPQLFEFTADLRRISGFQTDEQREANKQELMSNYVNRGEFLQRYGNTSNAEYVDRLARVAGVPLAAHQSLVSNLNAGQMTRAQVLRAVIQDDPAVYNKFFNKGFVVMQYFGYLRRDPDPLYLDWIALLNQTGDYRRMVFNFVNSAEYRARFGRP